MLWVIYSTYTIYTYNLKNPLLYQPSFDINLDGRVILSGRERACRLHACAKINSKLRDNSTLCISTPCRRTILRCLILRKVCISLSISRIVLCDFSCNDIFEMIQRYIQIMERIINRRNKKKEMMEGKRKWMKEKEVCP